VWVGVGVLVCDQRTPLHVCVYAHNACVPWVYVCAIPMYVHANIPTHIMHTCMLTR